MSVGGVGSSAVAAALAQSAESDPEKSILLLKKTLSSDEQTAQALLAPLGQGTRVNIEA